jgi:hypothetical protein
MDQQDLARLSAALAHLSQIPRDNLQEASRHSPFTEVIDLCVTIFPEQVGLTHDGKPARDDVRWGLLNLFDGTGVPTDATATSIATAIEDAMLATRGETIHLCPLDQADALPRLRFGPCEVRTFSRTEFSEVIQFERLKRRFRNLSIDINSFARFDWLVVREPVSFASTLKNRSGFFRHIDFRMDRDYGAIESYAKKWPAAVERAVFALLLLRWEDMVQYRDIDWRGFRIPWVYSVPADVLDAPPYPKGPETLTWEPDFQHDEETGGDVETERPFRLPLNDDLDGYYTGLTDERWHNLERAQASAIVNPLVVHFLTRSFASEGIDEFLGHITTIEAALGMSSDYGVGRSRPPIGSRNPGATERVRRRISALTGDPTMATLFGKLFDLRSTFIHGRPIADVSSTQRVQARVLARQVLECLIQTAQTSTAPDRDNYLTSLCP